MMKGCVAAVLTLLTVALGGCGGAADPGSEALRQPDAQAIEEATLMPPTVPPAVSVNALMVSSVDQAAHVIWDAGPDAAPPVTDDDWLALEYHGIQLAALGTMISVGGSGPADPGWARLPAWARYAQEMTDVGLKVRQDAVARDASGIALAGDQLVEICENCHAEFKPDLPTEGLFHTPHYPH